MKNYVRPIVLANEELAEGVYAASGGGSSSVTAGGDDCYIVTARIHQTPEIGRDDYRIQVDGRHETTHHSDHQILTLYFNQPVTYVSSQGELLSGNGTNTIEIDYHYHNNGVDNIGLGDVVVKSGDGLGITGAEFWCRREDDQH